MSVPCKNYRTYCRVAYCRINLNHDETTETMKNKRRFRRFRRFVVVRFFTIQEKYSFLTLQFAQRTRARESPDW